MFKHSWRLRTISLDSDFKGYPWIQKQEGLKNKDFEKMSVIG